MIMLYTLGKLAFFLSVPFQNQNIDRVRPDNICRATRAVHNV
jgi:hypothetical protein